MSLMTAIKALESHEVAGNPKMYQVTLGQIQIHPLHRLVQTMKIAKMKVAAVAMRKVRKVAK